MKKFFSGFLFGTTSFVLMPASIWDQMSPSVFLVQNQLKTMTETITYYFPSEIRKRKHEEIMKAKREKMPIRFEFMNNQKNDRKNLQFYTELQESIRMHEILANHRGLTRQEKISIIRKTIKKHYPEVFADFKESILKEIDNKVNDHALG
jgi:hypothetical protein